MRRSSIYIILGLIVLFLSVVIFSKCESKVENEAVELSDLYFGEPVSEKDTGSVIKDVDLPISYSQAARPCAQQIKYITKYITKEVIKEVIKEVPVIQERIVEIEKEIFIEIPVFQERIVEVEVIREVPVSTIDPEVTAWLFGQIANLELTEDHAFALYGNSGVYSLPDRRIGWNFGFTGHYRGVEAGVSFDPVNVLYQARVGYRIFQTKEKEEKEEFIKKLPNATN